MEIQLQELIDQIKKEGVETAEAEAEKIIKAANENAEKIISDAKAQAENILNLAKNENERIVKSGEDAIKQAGRNVLISFRECITKELNAIMGENVALTYSSDDLKNIIIKAVEGWVNKPDAEDISVILNGEDLKVFEEALLTKLKEKMLKGVTLKANDNFNKGFRISVNDGKVYYDYSSDAVVEMMSSYLSPRVTALLKEAENNG